MTDNEYNNECLFVSGWLIFSCGFAALGFFVVEFLSFVLFVVKCFFTLTPQRRGCYG